MRAGWALAAVVLLVAVPVSTLADGDHGTTGEGSLPGAGWARIDLSDDDGHLRVTVTATGPELPLALGADFVDSQGRSLFLSAVYFEKARDGFRVEVGSGSTEIVNEHREGGGFFVVEATYELHLRSSRAFDGEVVLWSADQAQETSWTVSGGSGSSIGDVSTGSDTFLAVDDDLEGPLEAESPPMLRGQVLAGRSVSVDGSLVGLFSHGGSSWDQMTMEGPQTSRQCPCAFGELGSHALGPGTYEFEATGVGFGDARWILLTGADVASP